MKVFAENENMMVVETKSKYGGLKYEVQVPYTYYDYDYEEMTEDNYCVYVSRDINDCMKYFEDNKDTIKEKPIEELEDISAWYRTCFY